MLYLKELYYLVLDIIRNRKSGLLMLFIALLAWGLSCCFSPYEYKYVSTLISTHPSSQVEIYNLMTGLDLSIDNMKSFRNPIYYNTIIKSENFLMKILKDSIDGIRVYEYMKENSRPSFKRKIQSLPSLMKNLLVFHDKNNETITEQDFRTATLNLRSRVQVEIDNNEGLIMLWTKTQNQELSYKLNELIIFELHNELLKLNDSFNSVLKENIQHELDECNIVYWDLKEKLADLKDANYSNFRNMSYYNLEVMRISSEIDIYRRLIEELNKEMLNEYTQLVKPTYFIKINGMLMDVFSSKFIKTLYVFFLQFLLLIYFKDIFHNKLKNYLLLLFCLFLFYTIIW